MDGAHDVGGMHGFGVVPIERDEAGFHEGWEARTWAMTLCLVRRTTIDRFRYTIEQMPPVEYLSSSYYARWLWAAERLSRDAVLLRGEGPMGGRRRPSPTEPVPSAAFTLGSRVRVRSLVTAEHSRVPRYLRRAEGRIERVAFAWPNPTESARNGFYGQPEVVYTVSFAGAELFGPPADHTVSADLSERELEAV